MGLIFLSAMTTAIAQACREQGLDARAALGSSLLTIAVSTFVVGLLVVLTGTLYRAIETFILSGTACKHQGDMRPLCRSPACVW